MRSHARFLSAFLNPSNKIYCCTFKMSEKVVFVIKSVWIGMSKRKGERGRGEKQRDKERQRDRLFERET